MLSCVWLFVTPWTVTCQASLSMGLSQQEYWSELPFPPPGNLLDPGIEPMSTVATALAGRFFTTWAIWEANIMIAQLLQLCPTLWGPMDCSLPGSSVQGILQARILEKSAISSFRGSSWPRDQTRSSCSSYIAGRFFTTEPLGKH